MFIAKACALVLFCWMYSIAWNIAPFFGWGNYVPEGILDSCSFDYFTRDLWVTTNNNLNVRFLILFIILRRIFRMSPAFSSLTIVCPY